MECCATCGIYPDRGVCHCPETAFDAMDNLENEIGRLQDSLVDTEAENAHLRSEVARLRAVIRHTHETYCTIEYTSRNLHAPECLLYEIEDGDPQ